MRRGTTPTLTFTLPDTIDTSTFTKLSLAFQQFGNNVIDKSLTDVTLGTHTVTVQLTESETLEFTANAPIFIQLRVGVGTSRLASNIINTTIGEILKGGLL